MMDLSIIIVNFNTKELLGKCLKSLGDKHEIIVVDNGSEDGSLDTVKEFINHQTSRLAAKQANIKLIQNEFNLGFAKAVNQGIKESTGDYLFLLNSDTEVKSGALEKLVKFAQEHLEAGVVGARLLNPDDSIQPSVYHLPTFFGAMREFWFGQNGSFQKYAPLGDESVEVEAVTGAAMLIPRRITERVGILDERYFMYFEDLDYCRRVKRVGLKVFYLPQAEIIHHHGASGKKISEKTHQWLIESSKIYHGVFKYYLITFIIWLGQKWQKYISKARNNTKMKTK